jgi:ribosomal protein S12 methylthiotransferase accessory factor
MIRPRFKAQYHVQILRPDKVFFLAESGYFVLSAASCATVAALIDGKRCTEEIVDLAMKEISMGQAYYVLAMMESKGYIEETDEALPASQLAFWNTQGMETSHVVERLGAGRASLHAVGDVPIEELRAAMERAGLTVAEEDKSQLRVVLTDDYLRPELSAINEEAIRTGKPWMLAKPQGMFAWVGPIFEPDKTACWACLSQRLRANRDIDNFLQGMTGRKHPFVAKAALRTTVQIGLELIALEAMKWIVQGENERLNNKLITFNTVSLAIEEHALVRRPQCEVCGDPAVQEQLSYPIEFRSVPKRHLVDGGHRAIPPEQTLRKLEHHVSPITGVVNRLVRITADDDPVQHVYVSGANMAVRTYSYDLLQSTLRARTAGKGTSDVQARVSAIGEAIERYSGTYRGDEAKVRGSFRSLGDQAVHPKSSMLFSESQYKDRKRWLDANSPFTRVPLPFNEDAVLDWAPLWSMTRKEVRYLPMESCYYSYPVPDDKHFCLPDSNGAAAGNTPEEAMLQGFLELVERDAVCIWWYNRLRRPAVDLESFDDPYIQDMKAFHKSVHRDLWVLDVTSDLGIPAMVAISRRKDKKSEDIVFAPAAHLDPQIAIQRALTEMNQLVSAVIDAKNGEPYTFDDPQSVNWWKTATIASEPYLLPSETLPRTRRTDFSSQWSADFREDLLACQALVESLGLEMLVHDQTRPDIGLPVMKVIVPGLRHFWARFAEGRLFDVPSKMGWAPQPLTEDQLNPIPIFI